MIQLIKHISPHLRLTVPLSVDDISGFGDGLRELFIKSSSYSVITIDLNDSGPTISWMFSSEPKSISFSVIYRESADTQVQQSKVCAHLLFHFWVNLYYYDWRQEKCHREKYSITHDCVLFSGSHSSDSLQFPQRDSQGSAESATRRPLHTRL